jgi:hypothetical protein
VCVVTSIYSNVFVDVEELVMEPSKLCFYRFYNTVAYFYMTVAESNKTTFVTNNECSSGNGDISAHT